MNPTSTSVHAVATAPVALRTGLLFLGGSLVVVALLGWSTARTTARMAVLEAERSGSEFHLVEVERTIGETPTTVAAAVQVAATPDH